MKRFKIFICFCLIVMMSNMVYAKDKSISNRWQIVLFGRTGINENLYGLKDNVLTLKKNKCVLVYDNFEALPKKIKMTNGNKVRIVVDKEKSIRTKLKLKSDSFRALKFVPSDEVALDVDEKKGTIKANIEGTFKLKIYEKIDERWKYKKKIKIAIKNKPISLNNDNKIQSEFQKPESIKLYGKVNEFDFLKDEKLEKNKLAEKEENDDFKNIELNEEDVYRIRVNTKTKISDVVYPKNAINKDIKYTTDNKKVVSVDKDGVIKALKAGKATITCTSLYDKKVQTKIHVCICSIDADKNQIVAHRGYSTEAPENSLAAYRLACEYGFYGVECDIYVTKDGKFVCNHNPSMLHMFGVDLEIPNCTYDEIKDIDMTNGQNIDKYPNEKIPRVEEYLDIIKKYGKCAVIELKGEMQYEDLVRLSEILDSYDMNDKIEIISFNVELMVNIRDIYSKKDCKVMPEFYVLSPKPEEVQSSLGDKSTLEWALENDFNIGCYYAVVNKDMVEKLHKKNLKCYIYCIDDYYFAYDTFDEFKIDSLAANTAEIIDL